MTNAVKILLLLFFCALTLLVSGCLNSQALYIGNKVTADKVPLVKDAHQVGTWETFDLKIDYEVFSRGELLEITGRIELGDHQKMVYDYVRSLDVYLFFLDDDSRVLLTEPLERTFRGSTEQTMLFTRSYKTPNDAKALSFGYSGQVAERDGQMSFYLLPLKK
jgi:hypothetical protein